MIHRLKYIFLLGALLSFHLFMNYELLQKSQVCRVYDEVNRLRDGLSYYDLIFSPQAQFKNIKNEALQLSGQAHPPFVQVVQAATMKLLSMTVKQFDEMPVILITNIFFLFILLISVYGIGAQIYNKNVGILAALLVSFFPIVYGSAKNMFLDFPLASMVALSFWFLFKTNKFRSLNYSILLGLAVGFSQLTKASALIFILVPLFYYFYASFKADRSKRIIFNFMVALLLAVIVAGSVYLKPSNFFAIKYYLNKSFFLDCGNRGILFYFKHPFVYAGIFLSLAMIPVLVSYFRNIRLQNKTIFLWFFVPLVIFSLSPNKAPRLIIAILPALALMVAGGLFQSKLLPRVKKIYAYILVLVAGLQYFVFLFNFSFLDHPFFRQEVNTDFKPMLTYIRNDYYSVVSKLLQFFKNDLKTTKVLPEYKVVFLFEIPDIHCSFQQKALFERVPLRVDCPEEGDEIDAPAPGTCDWSKVIINADYIVDKSGYRGEYRRRREDVSGMIREGFRKYKGNFKQVAEIELFDQSQLYVYRNLKLE